MTNRPSDINAFEFVTLAALRTVQLINGCTPRVEAAAKKAVTAQREVAARKIERIPAT